MKKLKLQAAPIVELDEAKVLRSKSYSSEKPAKKIKSIQNGGQSRNKHSLEDYTN